MALHHPGRRHSHGGIIRLLHLAERASDNVVVDPRGTNSCTRAHAARHRRKPGTDDNLVRHTRSCKGSQSLALRGHAALPSGRQRVQELLPNCCRDPGIQPDYHFGADLPTLPHCWYYLYRLVLVFWKVQRANLVSRSTQTLCRWNICVLTFGRHITIAKAIAISGFILGCATLNTGAKYCMSSQSDIENFRLPMS